MHCKGLGKVIFISTFILWVQFMRCASLPAMVILKWLEEALLTIVLLRFLAGCATGLVQLAPRMVPCHIPFWFPNGWDMGPISRQIWRTIFISNNIYTSTVLFGRTNGGLSWIASALFLMRGKTFSAYTPLARWLSCRLILPYWTAWPLYLGGGWVSEYKRMWMRYWTIELVECGSCIAGRDERESESIRYLWGGGKVVRCER